MMMTMMGAHDVPEVEVKLGKERNETCPLLHHLLLPVLKLCIMVSPRINFSSTIT
jgi:hypothetical protein